MTQTNIRLGFVLLVSLFLAQTPAPPPPAKTSIAVYPIKPAGAEASLATALTALLGTELTASPKLRVIQESMLKEVMERQAMNISDACDDTVCQVAIGKLVQAQKIVTGNLAKLGSKFILSLQLVDVADGTSDFSTKDLCECSEDQLDSLVAAAAAKIRNHFGEAIPVPALPQASPAPSPVAPATTAPSAEQGKTQIGSPILLAPVDAPEIPGPSSPNKAILYLNNRDGIRTCVSMNLQLDGISVNRLKTGHCIKMELDSGQHILGLFNKNIVVSVRAGDKYTAKLSCGSSMNVIPTPAKEAAQWVEKCEAIAGK
jgi:TolB-like protein